jgi:hypothetical protein
MGSLADRCSVPRALIHSSFRVPKSQTPVSRFHSFVKGPLWRKMPVSGDFLINISSRVLREGAPPQGPLHGASSDLPGLIFEDFQLKALCRVPFERLKFKTNLFSALQLFLSYLVLYRLSLFTLLLVVLGVLLLSSVHCGSCIECIVVILCVIVVLCGYCCFYFRCRTAG